MLCSLLGKMLDNRRFQRQHAKMKSNCLLSRYHLAAPGLFLGLAFLVCVSASAQNLLNNPGFNAPLSTGNVTTNWVIGYDYGSKEDFAIADRTTWAKRNFSDPDPSGTSWGAHFRPITEGAMKAYFKQTVSGLNPNSSYVVSGYMSNEWPNGIPNSIDIFIESRGILGNLRTASCADYSVYASKYSVTNKPKANGTIEVRLYIDKKGYSNDKASVSSARFDDISLTPLP
jgi:hypothetical protein